MPILIGQKLSSPIAMDVYGTHNQAVVQGKKLTSATVHQGAMVPIYVAPLSADKYVITVSSFRPGAFYSRFATQVWKVRFGWPVFLRDDIIRQGRNRKESGKCLYIINSIFFLIT